MIVHKIFIRAFSLSTNQVDAKIEIAATGVPVPSSANPPVPSSANPGFFKLDDIHPRLSGEVVCTEIKPYFSGDTLFDPDALHVIRCLPTSAIFVDGKRMNPGGEFCWREIPVQAAKLIG
jgi:hypothetical protein